MVNRTVATIWITGAAVAWLLACVSFAHDVAPANGEQTETQPAATDSTLADVRDLIRQGRYAQAENLARGLLAKAEAEHGLQSLQAAIAMDRVVESLWYSGRTRGTDARELAERALEIKQNLLEEDDLELADSLRNLAAVLRGLGEYEIAESHYERVVEIRKKELGPEDPSVARALTDLGNLYWYAEEYAKSIPIFERALTIQIESFGEKDPQVARTVNNMAVMYHEMGDFRKAEEFYGRALDIRDEVLGPDHLDTAYTLDGLAQLEVQLGDYARALELYGRALSIREGRFGPHHLHVGWSLNNLGYLHQRMGDYVHALSLWERALEIERAQLGEEHEDVAMTLGNLAELHTRMGDHDRAVALFEQSLAMREKVLGSDRTEVAETLVRFAPLLETLGEQERALEAYERARATLEKTVGSQHPYYAMCLEGLAGLAATRGEREEAIRLHTQALITRERALGKEHPQVATSLSHLASLHVEAGEDGEALDLFQQALQIREAALGPNHPGVASVLNEIAWLQIRGGHLSEAIDAALRGEEIARRHLCLTAQSLPERQALGYAAVRDRGLEAALFVAVSQSDVEATRRAWDALIQSRAVVLDEMVARRRSTARVEDVYVAQLRLELVAASQRLANLTIRGPGDDSSEIYRRLLDGALSDKERAERALAQVSVAFRRDQETRLTGFAEVVAHLPPGSALVGYALYEERGDPPSETTRQYAAFVLGPNDEDPSAVALGSADELDEIVRHWAREVRRPGRVDPGAVTGLESDYRTAAEPLRSRIWDPIAELLRGADLVFVVAEGILHQVNLTALPADGDRYLVESGPRLHYLSAERDLIRLAAPGAECRGLIAMGGPDYDAIEFYGPRESIPAARATAQFGTSPGTSLDQPARTRSSCADFRSMRFAALPASDREVQEIASLWSDFEGGTGNRTGTARSRGGVLDLTGPRASEGAFKRNVSGHCVVHLATHGFFLHGDCAPSRPSARGIGGVSAAFQVKPVAVDESPLLHSGLALAGANRREAAGPDMDDGILTAEEVAALDLNGVEWAVLSACDTGTGEIRAGEGVLGLRRAFEVAGARTVIMSLWPIEDETALRWMRALYQGRLARNLDVTQASAEASLQILTEERVSGGSTHPFRWAAFIAAGDWR